jgi:presenilin-like A22 family membrane protease
VAPVDQWVVVAVSTASRSIGPWRLEISMPRTIVLVSLLGGVVLAATQLSLWWSELSAGGEAPAAGEVAAAPGGSPLETAGLLVAAVLVDVAIILAFQRLPAWVRRKVVVGVVLGGVYLAGSLAQAGYQSGLSARAVGVLGLVVVAAPVAIAALDRARLWWLGFDASAVAIAVVAAAILGATLDPATWVALLVVLLVWDYVAVSTGVMGQLAAGVLEYRLPAVVLVPDRWRVELDALVGDLEGDDRPLLVGIGLGDLILPTGFAIAVARGGQPDVATAIAGGAVVALGLMSVLQVDGLRPALPWVGGGALAGYVAGLIVV